MYIHGRGNIGYLNGDMKEPEANDANDLAWDANNSMVMTWLVNSMEKDISSNCNLIEEFLVIYLTTF